LIEIRQQHGLDNVMFNKVKRALKYGYSRHDQDNLQFLNELPLQLRTKLSVIMHKDLLKNIQFFKNRSDKFLAIIGPMLKSLHVGINEYVFTEGEHANEMFFIKSGAVQMVLKEFNNFPFMYVEQGYYFGEVDLLFGETRKYTYQAKSECELLVLNKKNFTQLFFQDFRDMGAEIYNNALKRRQRSQKTHKEALTQCQNEEAKEKERKKSKVLSKISNPPDLKRTSGQKSPQAAKADSHGGFCANVEHLMDEIESKEEEKKIGTLLTERVEETHSIPETQQQVSGSENLISETRSAANLDEKGWKKRGLQIDTEAIEAEAGLEKRNSAGLGSGSTKAGKKRTSPNKKWSFLKNNLEHNGHGFMEAAGHLDPTLLSPAAAGLSGLFKGTGTPSPRSPGVNSEQFQLLQQRVETLEKSIEKILELYQSVAPQDDE